MTKTDPVLRRRGRPGIAFLAGARTRTTRIIIFFPLPVADRVRKYGQSRGGQKTNTTSCVYTATGSAEVASYNTFSSSVCISILSNRPSPKTSKGYVVDPTIVRARMAFDGQNGKRRVYETIILHITLLHGERVVHSRSHFHLHVTCVRTTNYRTKLLNKTNCRMTVNASPPVRRGPVHIFLLYGFF